MFEINYVLSVILIVSAVILLNISYYAFRKRELCGALAFAGIMIAFFFHTVGYAFELINTDLEIIKFWLKFEYIGVAFYPFLIIILAQQYTGTKNWVKIVTFPIYLSLSLLTLIFVITNDMHHLYFKSLTIDYSTVFPTLAIERNIWFWIQFIYMVYATLYALISYSRYYFKSTNIFRLRSIYMMIGIIGPIITGAFYLTKFAPINIDLVPFSYIFMSIIWIISLAKYRLLEFAPVTYKKVFEHMAEGVIVLDKNNHIVDFNPASVKVFKELEETKKGNLADILFRHYPQLLRLEAYNGQIIIDKVYGIKSYNVRMSLVYNRKNDPVGKIILFNDTTKEYQMMNVLKEHATIDDLTGLYNRRFFFEKCQEVLHEKVVGNANLYFVLIDIDYFKKVNDTYGHQAGDYMLKEIAKLCKNSIRENDFLGRYGGEEFALLLHDQSIENVYKIIERIRNNICNTYFTFKKHLHIKITASFGIYEFYQQKNESMSEIFMKADIALYQAKSEGRNRTVIYNKEKDVI